ncbi:MAG: YbjN domain-containing protein [Actinomycetia bacterium]|nr:YbjN domain-containing protein [Actinomycetes bacterium]
MADDNKTQAEQIFAAVTDFFDSKSYRYDVDKENFQLDTGFTTDDLDAPITIRVYPDNQSVILYSFLPFNFAPEQIEEACRAACAVTLKLYDGCWTVKPENGETFYRVGQTYADSIVGREMIDDMLGSSLAMIDAFNDRFEKLQKGLIPWEEVVEQEKN